jgi:hypothetical protein
VKLKLDENLPASAAPRLAALGYAVHTVLDESLVGKQDAVHVVTAPCHSLSQLDPKPSVTSRRVSWSVAELCNKADLNEVLQVALKGTTRNIGQQPLAFRQGERRVFQKSRNESRLARVQLLAGREDVGPDLANEPFADRRAAREILADQVERTAVI